MSRLRGVGGDGSRSTRVGVDPPSYCTETAQALVLMSSGLAEPDLCPPEGKGSEGKGSEGVVKPPSFPQQLQD